MTESPGVMNVQAADRPVTARRTGNAPVTSGLWNAARKMRKVARPPSTLTGESQFTHPGRCCDSPRQVAHPHTALQCGAFFMEQRMGTNFFLHEQKPKQCPTCGHTPNYEPLHIGKSSMGWCFSLHVIPEEGINTLEDWTMRWSKTGTIIKNEYGEQLTPFEMHDYITNRKGRANAWSASDLARNHAVRGLII